MFLSENNTILSCIVPVSIIIEERGGSFGGSSVIDSFVCKWNNFGMSELISGRSWIFQIPSARSA